MDGNTSDAIFNAEFKLHGNTFTGAKFHESSSSGSFSVLSSGSSSVNDFIKRDTVASL
jgi:hypothetical protein